MNARSRTTPWRGGARKAQRTAIAALFWVLGCLMAAPANARDYSLAVVPQMLPAVVYRDWTPFANRLGRDTASTFQIRVYRTFEEFETDLVNGLPDFVYLNPYHALMAYRAQGYLPLVRDGSRLLSGALVVQRDSPAQTVKDLDGQRIAFPDPNAFAASLYMRALLHERERVRFSPQFYTTHGNVYRHVILGDVAAGVGVNTTLARERPETRRELRVLYETPGTAPHPLCVHPRVPAPLRAAVTAAILRMAKDEAGLRLLTNVEMPQPVRADYARDYAPLEKLGLQRYTVPTRLPPR